MAKAQLGSISHPDMLRFKLEISGKQTRSQELLGLLNKQLNTELFLDPESAIRTIGGGKTPRQIFEGMMEAIEKITDVLEYLKILGR